MRIPKSFELGGRKWTVVRMEPEKYVDWIADAPPSCPFCATKEARWHADAGCCSLAHSKIVLVDSVWGDHGEQTYYHELAHAIYYAMGFIDEKDHPSEQVIELLGNMLHQYEKTKKGEVILD